MFNLIKRHLSQASLLVLFSLTAVVHAEESFENGGVITLVNKAAKVIAVDKQRMLIDDPVMVTYDNKQRHFLNVATEGMRVNISGVKGSNGVYTITSAYIYPKTPLQLGK